MIIGINGNIRIRINLVFSDKFSQMLKHLTFNWKILERSISPRAQYRYCLDTLFGQYLGKIDMFGGSFYGKNEYLGPNVFRIGRVK